MVKCRNSVQSCSVSDQIRVSSLGMPDTPCFRRRNTITNTIVTSARRRIVFHRLTTLLRHKLLALLCRVTLQHDGTYERNSHLK
jgi:hypothetical protein